MLRWLYTHIARVCLQCFICFSDVCCKRVLFGYCICFHTYVASILFGCCICLQWFSSVSISVSDVCLKCFIYLFLCCKCCIQMFRSRSSVTYEIHVGNYRGRERSLRAGGAGDVGWRVPRLAVRLRHGRATSSRPSPCVGAEKRTAAADVHPLAVPIEL
jgi:hypothetical protein